MLTDKTRKLLVLHEGRSKTLYKDSLGYWTIGVGHLVDPAKGGSLPDPIIDALLDYDIQQAWDRLVADIPWITQLDPVRQHVLLDMTFNMGDEPFDHDGFKDWPIFVQQVRTGAYRSAAINMRSTLWAKQVKTRAMRLAYMMETGEWPSDV
jgi:lysozyme